jgi:hypothetical protein
MASMRKLGSRLLPPSGYAIKELLAWQRRFGCMASPRSTRSCDYE